MLLDQMLLDESVLDKMLLSPSWLVWSDPGQGRGFKDDLKP